MSRDLTSDSLAEGLAPSLAAPVTRERVHGAGELAGGTAQSHSLGYHLGIWMGFADDDAE